MQMKSSCLPPLPREGIDEVVESMEFDKTLQEMANESPEAKAFWRKSLDDYEKDLED